MTEVFAVSCHDKISFESCIHKYPWVTGLFSRKQVHPLIGRAMCPAFKRKVCFPKDTMNCKVECLPNPTGTAVARQLYPKHKLLEWWHNDVFPSQLMFVGLGLYVFGVIGVQRVMASWLPYCSFIFYATRVVADRGLGIEWLPMYYYQ